MIPSFLAAPAAKIMGGAIVVLLVAGAFFYWQWRDAEREADLEQAAHEQTVANYRAAAEQARREDLENKVRVEAEQEAITERIEDDYETRLADARARADRLRQQLAADSGSGRAASVPGLSEPTGQPDGAAAATGFSIAERLIATEQAIQLDALQQWVREQTAVDVNGPQ